jgi:alpha-tubulin suppressor-like RCC1 family protein
MSPSRLAARKFSSRRTAAGALAALVFAAACSGTDLSNVSAPDLAPTAPARRSISAATTPAVRLFMGSGNMCVLDPAGASKCWGRNNDGQLGNAGTSDVLTPTPIGGGLSFAMLGVGDNASCGVTTSGAAYCWGADQERWPWQNDYRLLPRAVSGNGLFTQVLPNGYDACGISTTGVASCWLAILTDVYTPQAVPNAPTFVDLVAGGQFQCGRASSGQVSCWGFNASGQIGNGTTGGQNVPVSAIGGARRFITIAAGFAHACGLDLGGTAYCWGLNFSGALGDGTLVDRNVPTRVATTLRFTKIAAGNTTTCALTAAGAAYCWGNGYQGQVGNGVEGIATTPVAVQGGLIFRDIVAGGLNSCCVTYHAQIYCWGYKQYGEFHDGTKSQHDTPYLLPL